jgi:hypothetical protein
MRLLFILRIVVFKFNRKGLRRHLFPPSRCFWGEWKPCTILRGDLKLVTGFISGLPCPGTSSPATLSVRILREHDWWEAAGHVTQHLAGDVVIGSLSVVFSFSHHLCLFGGFLPLPPFRQQNSAAL